MTAKSKSEIRRHRITGRPSPATADPHLVFAPLWITNDINAGTLARTADALRAGLALPTSAGRALHRGNTVGANTVPVTWVTDPMWWIKDRLRDGWFIVAVELAHGATLLADLGRAPGRTAILLGHEVGGIPDDALALADVTVEIPMRGHGVSLNVAVAGSLVGYKLAGLA